jgi:hypothetical protein
MDRSIGAAMESAPVRTIVDMVRMLRIGPLVFEVLSCFCRETGPMLLLSGTTIARVFPLCRVLFLDCFWKGHEALNRREVRTPGWSMRISDTILLPDKQIEAVTVGRFA